MNPDDLILTDDDLDQLLEARNPYLAQPARALELVVRLAGGAAPRHPAVSALEQLAGERMAALAARAGAPAMPELAEGMRALIGAIGALVSFPSLANRIVVGIGGAFSAGKSRFLNSLSGTDLLPEDLGPCTVIPTYLGHGATQAVALSAFGQTVPMDADALAAISHAFSRHHQLGCGTADGLSHLVRLLMVSHEAMPWKRLVFLDTPGYNPPGRDGEQGDAEVARQQLAGADHLVWLVSARNGGLRADDIAFLRAAGPRAPVFFVLTQADLVSRSAIDVLLDAVREAAARAGIPCAGAMAWAAPGGGIGGGYCGGHCGGDDIRPWLDRIDADTRYPGLRRRCLDLADRWVLHCRRALAGQQAMLTALNELQVLAGTAGTGRHPELEAELRRLRQVQSERHTLPAEIDACRKDLAAAVSALLGPLVEDEAPGGGDRLLLDCPRAGFDAIPPAGAAFPLRFVGARPDLKHVLAVFLAGGGELRIPFSRIRQCWGIDPLAVGGHSELAAELVEASDTRLTFAIYHYNHH
jgi:hypothetical protein